MHIRGGYRIVSASSDTVDVSSTTADRDYVQVMNAVIATKRKISFPTTPILDEFNRPTRTARQRNLGDNEKAFNRGQLAVISKEAGQSSGGGSWWDENWEDCGEAYVTIRTSTRSRTAATASISMAAVTATTARSSPAEHRGATYGMGWPVIFFGRSDIHGAAKILALGMRSETR